MFFDRDFIDVILKDNQSVRKFKKYNLIFEMTISNPKTGFYLLHLYILI